MIRPKRTAAIITILALLTMAPKTMGFDSGNMVLASDQVYVESCTTIESPVILDKLPENQIVHYSTAAPLNSYKGAAGVTIRSYSTAYKDTAKLKAVYDELMKNTIGPEISYLSYIDLIPDYPRGRGTAGMWYGQWTSTNKLSPGRKIEIFGVDEISFESLASVLSHEYGHHFTYYHLLNKEGKTPSSSSSGFYKLRNLGSYGPISSGYHEWEPGEIAAEDYKQLFGSPTAKVSYQFYDVRDKVESRQENYYYSSSMFNFWPQENYYLPLAWQVSGLYSYWTNLSGVKPVNKVPPSAPVLTLSKVEKINTVFGTKTSATLSWTKSVDDTTEDMEYTVVYFEDNMNYPEAPGIYAPIRTTTDSRGRDAVIGTYSKGSWSYTDAVLSSKVTVRVYAKDEDGNIVASNDLKLDPANLVPAVTKDYVRIAGDNRYSTSLKLSQTGWTGTSDTVILATGANFPDALSAAPLAKKYNAPILLTDGKKLSADIENELKRLSVKNIFVIGGTGVISSDIVIYLREKGYTVIRLGGQNRYETSIEIAKHLGNFDKIVVATGSSFPDALSIAPYAASEGMPILLTTTEKLPDSVAKFIDSRNISKTYVIGGTGVVSDAVKNSLPNAERISGSDRYETNHAVLQRFDGDFSCSLLYVATGDNFPDALSGSALAALTKSPIVLTNSSKMQMAKSFVSSKFDKISKVNFIGGDGVISSADLLEIITKQQ
ncbi:cell wall-binding repeat-containing protein [Clostridium thermarum]|uniref:cell wall-binding repeat-containing protein n=1 Tax=Clostridium thermarum TaxID=1716543 RepID=UPI0013D00B5B|nr:cell wall-binding repeat-containing protein [Clostridium thermarum]